MPSTIGERARPCRGRPVRREGVARALLVAERVSAEQRGGLGAEQDLAGLRRGLHLDGPRRCRPGDEQLAMRLADEEELEAAGVEAGVHLQLDGAGRRPRPSDRAQRPAHLERRARRARCVVVALVEQQQRVAAELEQAAALRVGDGEQRREGRVHDLGDLLRAGSAEAGEPLGHRREARDVDERERSVDLAPDRLGIVAEPLERQPWDERDELG